MTTPSRLLGPALAGGLALLASPLARADMFSPGDLARAHAALEGITNCTKCHVAGEQLSSERCLQCHSELRERVTRGRGYHGSLTPAERGACQTCHHEHQGRDFGLVDWGKGGRKDFNHVRAGWELRGKHRRTDCLKCHDRRLVGDPAVLEIVSKQPNRVTYLGAPMACARCHFDEHRGQLGPAGAECQRCHGEDAWKPARGFSHARSAYPLDGKHVRVACAKCHKPELEAEARTATPGQTGPVSPSAFVRYKGMPFKACTDCHRDPHQSRFGERCTSCHTTQDWKRMIGAGAQIAFHEKTRYPLRGAHAEVKCVSCHGPVRAVKAKYKGLAFERCTDCHEDSHVGQLAKGPAPVQSTAPARGSAARATCDACHRLDAWIPATFEADDHQRLAYRLEGAHRTVACALCHPREPRLESRVPAAVRARLERMKRPVRVSLALLQIPRANDCRRCHRDPHAGQFPPKGNDEGCSTCHGLEGWRKLRFDHAKDSRFPLLGKHANAACGSCHRPDAAGVARYKPLAVACAGCHVDPHARQFAPAAAGQGSDCARCHNAASWKDKDLLFRHEPPFTAYVLDGKHRKVECARCHGTVRIAGAEVRRYRPLASACEACHVDFHRGAFRAFAPSALAGASVAPPAKASLRSGRADLAVRPASAGAGTATGCAACHSTEDWKRGAFDHDRTGFPLESAHRATSCAACHGQGTLTRAVPRACSACHRDVHARRLGARCERCHQATSWRQTTFDADAHRRSAFPLTGRHAFTPCDSCHGDKRDRGFERPVPACVACHEPDWLRASSPGAPVDHVAASFPRTCQVCHSTWRFSPAGFPAHDVCFQITHGPHSGIRCLSCHSTFPAVPAGQLFTCQSDTANCIQCHACSQHPAVQGFACANRKCYECHSFTAGASLPRGGPL